jgi:hypothetical protein
MAKTEDFASFGVTEGNDNIFAPEMLKRKSHQNKKNSLKHIFYSTQKSKTNNRKNKETGLIPTNKQNLSIGIRVRGNKYSEQ